MEVRVPPSALMFVLGVLVLSETITVTVLAGIALVLTEVALTRLTRKTAASEHPAE